MAENLRLKLEAYVNVRASPEQFHHMFARRPHHLSKATPNNVQGCDLLEGEWGKVGAVVYWKYLHDGKLQIAKQVVEAVEPEKNLITFKMIEGDLMKKYKFFRTTIQVSPNPMVGLGSVVHWTLEYENIHDQIYPPEAIIHTSVEMSKEIDDFLLSEN